MIGQVLQYLNNYFEDTVESFDEVVVDGVLGSFSEYYVAGMYIHLRNSRLNDGVYKIVSATTTKITVEETLIAEKDPNALYTVFGLSIPRDLITIIAEIEAFTPSDGAVSESIDDYSISYNGDGSWQSVYKNKLARYKKVYNTLGAYYDKEIL